MREEQAAVRWDVQTGILVIHLPAAADIETVTEALRRIHAQLGPEALRLRLWDARKVRQARDLAPVRATADLVAELQGEGAGVGRAALLCSDGAFYDSAVTYVGFLPQGYPLQVFRSYHEAVDWLLS